LSSFLRPDHGNAPLVLPLLITLLWRVAALEVGDKVLVAVAAQEDSEQGLLLP
jgi:hypothetical protein